MWNSTDIFYALIGGGLIGLAASIFLIGNGRVMGVSGIFKGVLFREKDDVSWRFSFLAGLFIGGLILLLTGHDFFQFTLQRSVEVQILGGLLVGIGVTFGNGCTSGHGVCGVSRFSTRSIFATIIFSLMAIITATFIQFILGGSI